VAILYYHYIEINPNPTGDPGRSNLLVTPANFDAQLGYLKINGWTPISLDLLSESFANPKVLPAKPIILTFDDGYSDFYSNAWPIIQKYNFKVTLFVMSRFGQNGACVTNIYIPGLYMTADQVTELSHSPLITIGAHTQDHCYLKKKSEVIQRQEILGSKSELEQAIGRKVIHFAYPYGSFDEISQKLVKEAGFETASSTIGGIYHNESTRYSLRRLHVGNWDAARFSQLLPR
jgi:peptidoglycan/xylan/chitin deacetylase (PgdA/CDA1 family)